MKPQWEVSIKAVENGYIVQVGCKTFVAASIEFMIEELKLYFTNTEASIKKFAPEILDTKVEQARDVNQAVVNGLVGDLQREPGCAGSQTIPNLT